MFQAACCCGSAACSLCCAACPNSKNSTVTRIAYAFFLLLGTIVACVMLAPSLTDKLKNVSIRLFALNCCISVLSFSLFSNCYVNCYHSLMNYNLIMGVGKWNHEYHEICHSVTFYMKKKRVQTML